MEFSEILEYRQSTRKYTDEKLTKEQIEYILNAAYRAPVAANYMKICISP